AISVPGAAGASGSSGSGFVLNAQGDIVTNDHVVAGASGGQVLVTLADGRQFPATVTGLDPTTDLAIVRLNDPPADLRPVTFGDSNALQVGDPVLAMGNPLGLANTATTGIISALNRPVTVATGPGQPGQVTNAIQIDAAINPGNSGGPLFNAQGEVIGVTSSIVTMGGPFGGAAGSIGLGFAIPANLAERISAELVADGVAQHALLGVTVSTTTTDVVGIQRGGGQIQSITPGSAAAAAGLQVGDVVVAFNGNPVAGSDSLTAFVRERIPGDLVYLTVVREGEVLEIPVTLGALGTV
ncbi:MAG: trypsin-like peptidase domain-containing protein, partial [Promicromonosporaceae bacterium]|nr:trypsin-like peptidase domain-containing protein [Promicromonosporaceae bacterium]